MKIVLGIDLGTQSLKTVCYDYDSKSLIHVHASPLEVDRDENGKAEQSANDWLMALRECTRNIPCLLYTSPSPRDATLSRMPSSA